MRLFKRVNHATVVAYLALFFTLGGVGYAAMRLPAGSVGTTQLRAGAVTLKKLARGTRSALRGPRGPQGPQGPQGSPGPKGDTGPAGPATGAAGGDLSGTYPSPTIAAGAVTTPKLAAGAVTGPILAPNAVTPDKFGVIPAARATFNIDYLIANGTQYSIKWDGTSYNEGGSYDDQLKTLQAPISGLYQIDAGADWAANSAGQRFIGIEVDASCCNAGNWTNATGGGVETVQSTGDLLYLTAGQHVSLNVMQSSGGDLTLKDTGGTFIAMHWVGP